MADQRGKKSFVSSLTKFFYCVSSQNLVIDTFKSIIAICAFVRWGMIFRVLKIKILRIGQGRICQKVVDSFVYATLCIKLCVL